MSERMKAFLTGLLMVVLGFGIFTVLLPGLQYFTGDVLVFGTMMIPPPLSMAFLRSILPLLSHYPTSYFGSGYTTFDILIRTVCLAIGCVGFFTLGFAVLAPKSEFEIPDIPAEQYVEE